ncbi:hypothetical protein EYF80_019890 [Liparis tanakae]|uniref:Uncharacterized protein n=1 Tax=Liparis tanakae TaxID=230148 RepID=A0A4Z2HY13_9TELE|nr:hypothetical protein EYF80_019890 [Liparis tanakae]
MACLKGLDGATAVTFMEPEASEIYGAEATHSEASSPKLSLLKLTWYLIPDLKYPRKVLDSEFCSSLYCTGPPPRKGGGGEEQYVGVPGEEAAMQGLRNRLQVHVLDTPNLQARLLPCTRKLLMGNHDGSERKMDMKEEGRRGRE